MTVVYALAAFVGIVAVFFIGLFAVVLYFMRQDRKRAMGRGK